MTMSKNVYVGNLAFSVTSDSLRELFEQYGSVSSASVVMDRDTGRSKGFAFVEMPDQAAGSAAIEGLDGKEVDGRDIRVNEARPREERRSRPSRY